MRTCTVPECGHDEMSSGYCSAHYQRLRKHGDVKPEVPVRHKAGGPHRCVVSDCDRDSRRRSGLCDKHHQRWLTRGKPEIASLAGPRRYVERTTSRRINNDGYVVVYAPDHPNAQGTGWILGHRKVMSDHLGRPLERDEVPHHKNGIRTDNRIENLELCVFIHPKGQRVEDLLAFAREVLARYERPDRSGRHDRR